MQVVYHMGVHSTDEDRLLKSLLKNTGVLAPRGTAVPAPGRYRPILPKTIAALRGAPAPEETQAVLLDGILDDDHATRVVFSHDMFFCIPLGAISDQGLYPMAGKRIAQLSNVFPDAGNEFHFALCNPATLIPALIQRVGGATYESLMGEIDPLSLRWAPVIEQILDRVPDADLTLWCNEDAALLWPDLIRSLAGLPEDTGVEGETDLVATLIRDDGCARLDAYLAAHPGLSAGQRRRVIAAFLEKYALPGAVEVELPLPGWSAALVEDITAAYDEDVARIAAFPQLDFLHP